MKKLFTHENRIIVFNLKNVLRAEGIDTVVVNEFAGGGVGDLATFDTWPELWIEDEAQWQPAQTIVENILRAGTGSDWYCSSCQEKNADSFEICWNCGHEPGILS